MATAVSGTAYDQFLERWAAANSSAPASSLHIYAYDATNLLLNAIEATAVSNSAGSLLIGRQALRQSLSETAQYGGLSGVLTCMPNGSCADRSSFGVYQLTNAEISGGRWPPQVVWP
jgi:ABC-type branched-subunit amino acid transport system substrate-binding protein